MLSKLVPQTFFRNHLILNRLKSLYLHIVKEGTKCLLTDPATGAIVPGAEHLIIIGVSACLAGAVMGDHCSPISDTTIMASAGAQCNHINHVSTQVPYVLTVAAISFVNYIIAGFVQNVVICLVIGILLTLATLLVLKRVFGQKAATQQ